MTISIHSNGTHCNRTILIQICSPNRIMNNRLYLYQIYNFSSEYTTSILEYTTYEWSLIRHRLLGILLLLDILQVHGISADHTNMYRCSNAVYLCVLLPSHQYHLWYIQKKREKRKYAKIHKRYYEKLKEISLNTNHLTVKR